MKKIIIFFLLFKSLASFGQNDSINSKLLKSGNLKIDSIEVQISVYENRIETESYFEKSKSKLSTVYFKTGKSFNEIITRENSSMPEDFWRTNEFEFKNGKVFNGKERFYFSGRMHGIAGSISQEVKESYNKALNSEFLKKYVIELFDKIKNYR